VEIRKARHEDIDACARVLAAAFQDDPGTVNFEPDDDRRRRVLPLFFRTFVAAALADRGDLIVVGDPVEGLASWFGPDQHGPSPAAMDANGFGDVLTAAGPESADRLVAMVGEIERQHEQLIRGPHLRLEFFGVLPGRQGSGLGTALIEDGHRRADELALPAYLETFTDPNVNFYRRRGYEVVGEFTIANGSLGRGMIRPAAPRSDEPSRD
jgi:ribosomal protein S18 acetylase RimI-like enzyme